MLKQLLREIAHSRLIYPAFDHSFFKPRPIDIFYNPLYLLRRGLFVAIARAAPRFSGRLLDVGCGSKPYEALFRVSQYVGVDVPISGHPRENKHTDIFYDGRTLPFADGVFDGVFCSEVFEHVFTPLALLAEIHRVLKPGALLLMTVPFTWMEHEQPYDFARYTSFGLAALVEGSGFKIERVTKVGSYVEAIAQVFTEHKMFHNVFSRMFVVVPIHLIALLAKRILPSDDRLFINLVMLGRKVDTPKISA